MKKNKKRNVIIFVFIIMIFFNCILIYKFSSEYKLQKDINSHYSSYVKVIRSTKLYNSKLKKVVSLKKGITLHLENKINSKYFHIKDTNYYVYYDDVEKSNEENLNINSNYLVFNKNIKISKNSIFYNNDEEVVKLYDSISVPINYMNDKYYFVSFLGQTLQVNKEQCEVYSNNNTDEKEANYISVINNKKIYKDDEECNDEFCVSSDMLKTELDYFKENGYYSISLDEYKMWLEGKIRLKQKAILLITLNDIDKSILDNYDFNIYNVSNNNLYRFIDADIKSDKNTNLDSINQYVIKRDTSLDDIKKMVNGETIVNMSNFSTVQGVPVLNYHFFYDSSLGESCNEIICLDVSKFREQLNYLRDNGYKTLTIEEYRKWIYGEIDVPLKSVLITIDDGALGTGRLNGNKLIPLLEEYKMHATLFLITAWWNKDDYKSSYLDIQSHGDDIHITGNCGDYNINCLSKDELLNDLKLSINKLGNNTAFCFPFYTYNEMSLQVLKEAGFSLGFIGGNTKSTRNSNKYLIPRYPIYDNTSLSEFIKIVN